MSDGEGEKMSEFLRRAMESRGVRPLEVADDVGLLHINASAQYAQVESYRAADSALIERFRPLVRFALDSGRLVKLSEDIYLKGHVAQGQEREVFRYEIWIAPGCDDAAHVAAVATFAKPYPTVVGQFEGVADVGLVDVLTLESTTAWAWLIWSDEPIFLNDPGLTKN